VFSTLHDSHHQAPNAFIGVPSFISSGLLIAVCYLPVRIFDAVAAGGFTSGMLLGYAAYMFVHHATHHFSIRPGDWLYAARVRHMAHHYHDHANFGVSTGFWDRVFGTTGARRGRFVRT
jgi:sterol desaturase/sphingolipid hydroxylase (fatty acid hydroxylase superfamily)